MKNKKRTLYPSLMKRLVTMLMMLALLLSILPINAAPVFAKGFNIGDESNEESVLMHSNYYDMSDPSRRAGMYVKKSNWQHDDKGDYIDWEILTNGDQSIDTIQEHGIRIFCRSLWKRQRIFPIKCLKINGKVQRTAIRLHG